MPLRDVSVRTHTNKYSAFTIVGRKKKKEKRKGEGEAVLLLIKRIINSRNTEREYRRGRHAENEPSKSIGESTYPLELALLLSSLPLLGALRIFPLFLSTR